MIWNEIWCTIAVSIYFWIFNHCYSMCLQICTLTVHLNSNNIYFIHHAECGPIILSISMLWTVMLDSQTLWARLAFSLQCMSVLVGSRYYWLNSMLIVVVFSSVELLLRPVCFSVHSFVRSSIRVYSYHSGDRCTRIYFLT